MIAEHVQAVLDLIGGVSNVTVYDAQVPNKPTFPYVVVYGNQGNPARSSLQAVSDWQEFEVQTTTVAVNGPQARALADRVQSALLDVAPTVQGRACGPISKATTQPLRRDDDVDPAVFYAVDVWQFTSVPS